jgi:hypothetical protein
MAVKSFITVVQVPLPITIFVYISLSAVPKENNLIVQVRFHIADIILVCSWNRAVIITVNVQQKGNKNLFVCGSTREVLLKGKAKYNWPPCTS